MKNITANPLARIVFRRGGRALLFVYVIALAISLGAARRVEALCTPLASRVDSNCCTAEVETCRDLAGRPGVGIGLEYAKSKARRCFAERCPLLWSFRGDRVVCPECEETLRRFYEALDRETFWRLEYELAQSADAKSDAERALDSVAAQALAMYAELRSNNCWQPNCLAATKVVPPEPPKKETFVEPTPSQPLEQISGPEEDGNIAEPQVADGAFVTVADEDGKDGGGQPKLPPGEQPKTGPNPPPAGQGGAKPSGGSAAGGGAGAGGAGAGGQPTTTSSCDICDDREARLAELREKVREARTRLDQANDEAARAKREAIEANTTASLLEAEHARDPAKVSATQVEFAKMKVATLRARASNWEASAENEKRNIGILNGEIERMLEWIGECTKLCPGGKTKPAPNPPAGSGKSQPPPSSGGKGGAKPPAPGPGPKPPTEEDLCRQRCLELILERTRLIDEWLALRNRIEAESARARELRAAATALEQAGQKGPAEANKAAAAEAEAAANLLKADEARLSKNIDERTKEIDACVAKCPPLTGGTIDPKAWKLKSHVPLNKEGGVLQPPQIAEVFKVPGGPGAQPPPPPPPPPPGQPTSIPPTLVPTQVPTSAPPPPPPGQTPTSPPPPPPQTPTSPPPPPPPPATAAPTMTSQPPTPTPTRTATLPPPPPPPSNTCQQLSGEYSSTGAGCGFGPVTATVSGSTITLNPLGANGAQGFTASGSNGAASNSQNLIIMGAQGHTCTLTCQSATRFTLDCRRPATGPAEATCSQSYNR